MALEINKQPWALPNVFVWLQKEGQIPKEDLNRTFNCGVGMVLVVSKPMEKTIKDFFEKAGEKIYHIGTIVRQPMKKVIIHD